MRPVTWNDSGDSIRARTVPDAAKPPPPAALTAAVRTQGGSAAAPVRRGRPLDPGKDRAILMAARALLFARGPRALTMEAVARAAGVSKPTLYSRYAGRRELLLAVVAGDAASVFRAPHRNAAPIIGG